MGAHRVRPFVHRRSQIASRISRDTGVAETSTFPGSVARRLERTMDLRLTDRDVWLSTLLFAVIGGALLIPMPSLYSNERLSQSFHPIALGSALFWGLLAILLMGRYWHLYYRYIYPDWMRSIAPLNTILYAAFGIGIWQITLSFPGPRILVFCILGGLEGILEHIFAVYLLRVLEKVPFLEGLKPLPVILFSFFEYLAYWAVVAWTALGFSHLL